MGMATEARKRMQEMNLTTESDRERAWRERYKRRDSARGAGECCRFCEQLQDQFLQAD